MYLFKRFTILYVLILGACSRGPGAQCYIDLKDPARPILYWIPDDHDKKLIRQEELHGLCALFVMQEGKAATTPVSLRALLRNDSCFITPVMPLGQQMSFEWQIYRGKDTTRMYFHTPDIHPTLQGNVRVESIYPLKDSLPENILLFHVFFSQPMKEDDQAYRHVHIRNEAGKELPFTWRQKASWSDSGKQLILMIHPGRIKRGINYASETGILFTPGKHYILETDDSLFSQQGLSATPYKKQFYIQKSDRESPAFITDNKYAKPAHGTQDPLYIVFTEAMDYGAVSIGLELTDVKGRVCKGHFQALNDRVWIYIPNETWGFGPYHLMYNDYLADLASNHISRLFEVQKIEGIERTMGLAFKFVPW